MKWQEKSYIFTKNSQMASISAIFTSTCHTKQLNSSPNSSASRMMNHSRLPACQGKMEPFERHPSTRGHLEKEAWVKADCTTFSSIKHMCCWSIDVVIKWQWKVCLKTVCKRPLLANPVTYKMYNQIKIDFTINNMQKQLLLVTTYNQSKYTSKVF